MVPTSSCSHPLGRRCCFWAEGKQSFPTHPHPHTPSQQGDMFRCSLLKGRDLAELKQRKDCYRLLRDTVRYYQGSVSSNSPSTQVGHSRQAGLRLPCSSRCSGEHKVGEFISFGEHGQISSQYYYKKKTKNIPKPTPQKPCSKTLDPSAWKLQVALH